MLDFWISFFKHHFKGDRTLWALILLFTIISFLAVYSNLPNIVYVMADDGKVSLGGKMFTQLIFVTLGFIGLYIAHRTPFRFYGVISLVGLFISVVLLILALLTKSQINGESTSRWVKVGGFTLQPSILATLALIVYISRYLAVAYNEKPRFRDTILPFWIPLFATTILILPANLSTALLTLSSVLTLAFIARLPIRNILTGITSSILLAVVIIAFLKITNIGISSRVDTWKSRIEAFWNKNDNTREEGYQIERCKMAIANGGFLLGQGPGKSAMRNFLPNSSSDFSFATTVEEYGVFGGWIIIILYLLLLFRIITIAQKAKTLNGQLLVTGIGFWILFQAILNMGVAVDLLPLTGQNLPLISSGGTSIIATYTALGCILSVSRSKSSDGQKEKDVNDEEIAAEIGQMIDTAEEKRQKRKAKKLEEQAAKKKKKRTSSNKPL